MEGKLRSFKYTYGNLTIYINESIKQMSLNSKSKINVYKDSSKMSSSKIQANIFEEDSISSTVKQKHACLFPECGKVFGKADRLIVHKRIHTGERPFVCNYDKCDKSYTRRFHLTRHIAVSHNNTKHSISNEVFRCDKCENCFNNPYSLKKHEVNYHSKVRYSCNVCGQSFRKQQHLKTHSYEHTGIKPYKCSYPGCDKRFEIPSRLNRHALTHLKGRYICPYESCLDRFDCYSDLRLHLSLSHPKKCDICYLEFKYLAQLKSHLKTHETDGMREAYFCPYTPCERYYLDMKNLHIHIGSKHCKNVKEFKCHVCEKCLVTKQKLKLHMKIHDANYQRDFNIKGPRKPRKDKGTSKTDFAKLLSGYQSDSDLPKDCDDTVSNLSESSLEVSYEESEKGSVIGEMEQFFNEMDKLSADDNRSVSIT